MNPTQLALTLARMAILFVLPLGVMLSGLVTTLQTGSVDWLTQGAGPGLAFAFGLRSLLDVLVFRLMRVPISAIVVAPIGRLFCMAVATRALLSHAGLVQTHWRGASFVSGRMIIAEQAKA